MLRSIAPLIARLASGENLTSGDVADIFEVTSREDTEGYYYLAFAVALMAKGPTTDELLGLVQGLQRFAQHVAVNIPPDQLIDVSGSGGDSVKTFNVSTAAAFVVAACGEHVVKQSFRAFTSYSGSSDVLQDVGVVLPDQPAEISELLDRVGIAPVNYATSYPGMEPRLAATAKFREIGLQFPTPMHPVALIPCPVNLKRRLYGLYTPKLLRPVSEIFRSLDYSRAMVVHGEPGLDEISTLGTTHICELNRGEIQEYSVSPAEMGFDQAEVEQVTVNGREQSTDIFLRVLTGRDAGPRSNLVAANAGAALYVCDRAASLKEGANLAKRCLTEGKAITKLKELVLQTAGPAGLATLEARLSQALEA